MRPEDLEFEELEFDDEPLDDVEFDDDDEDIEGFEMYLDDFDDPDEEFDGEDIERRRRRRRRSRRRAMRRSRTSFRKGRRPRKRYATVEQVSKGFARSDRNDKMLGRRISALKSSAARFATRTNRGIKKNAKDIDNIRQMTLFTALLGGDKKLEVTGVTDAAGNPVEELKGHKISVKDASDKLDKLLPFMMMGGMGDSKGGAFGGNPMMMFLLIDAMGSD